MAQHSEALAEDLSLVYHLHLQFQVIYCHLLALQAPPPCVHI